MAPVVGQKIRAPELEALRGHILLDRFGAKQAWNPKERRKLGGVAERRRRRGDARVNLLLGLFGRHLVEGERVVLAVGADRMAGGDVFAYAFRAGQRLLTDDEKGRLDALIGEDLQDLVAVTRQWPVIEGQHHFVIPERQGLRILHRADAWMLARIDHEGSRGADRVRVAGTIGGGSGAWGGAGEKSQAEDRPTPDLDASQTTTDHEAPTAFHSIAMTNPRVMNAALTSRIHPRF